MEPSQLQLMISKWKQVQAAHDQWQLLQDKREELEDGLDRLKEEMDLLLIKNDPVIEEKQKLIDLCKQKKRDVDALLDELEDNYEHDRDRLLDDIIQILSVEHPETAKEYEALSFSLQSELHLEREGHTAKEIFQQVTAQMDKIASIRESIKKKGVISYIFGPNPNGMITLHLMELKGVLNAALPKIESLAGETLGGDNLSIVYAEIIAFFSELQMQCDESWGFKKLDTFINKGIGKCQLFDRYFTELYHQAYANRIKTEEEIKMLLEKLG